MRGNLRLRFPDASLSPPISASLTVGRGNPPCLNDPTCSRQHFVLSPVEGSSSALLLRVIGANPACVEVGECPDCAGVQAAGWERKTMQFLGGSYSPCGSRIINPGVKVGTVRGHMPGSGPPGYWPMSLHVSVISHNR